jgi:hypothetical protein
MNHRSFRKLRLVSEGETLTLSFDFKFLPYRIVGGVVVFALIWFTVPHHMPSAADALGVAAIGVLWLAQVAGLLNRVSIRVNRNGVTVARRLNLFPALRFPVRKFRRFATAASSICPRQLHELRSVAALWKRQGGPAHQGFNGY